MSPELKRMIEDLRGYEMSDAEREEQRRSFVHGNVSMANPVVARDLVDEVADVTPVSES